MDTPAHRLDTPLIAAVHDKSAAKLGWRQANMLRTFLFEVFRYCIPKGLIANNFAAEVIPKPRPKSQPRANRPWHVDELMFVVENAPPHIAAVVALIAATGLDPSDALSLRRDKIKAGVIYAKRGKTGREVAQPVTGRLRAALDAAPKHDALTVLATRKGKPWIYTGFSTVWHRWKVNQAVAGNMSADLTLKGLRHTVGTILRAGGPNLRQIADYLGQSEEAIAHWYSRDADMAERNRIAADVLDSQIKRRTKIVKSLPKTVKPYERSGS